MAQFRIRMLTTCGVEDGQVIEADYYRLSAETLFVEFKDKEHQVVYAAQSKYISDITRVDG